MTREVLATCHDTSVLHTLHICSRKLSHLVSVFAKRTSMNNGILRIDIDIHNRRIVDMNIHHLTLLGHSKSHLVDQRVITQCTQLHLLREEWKLTKTHRGTPFSIDRYQHRHFAHCLQLIHSIQIARQTILDNQQTANTFYTYQGIRQQCMFVGEDITIRL